MMMITRGERSRNKKESGEKGDEQKSNQGFSFELGDLGLRRDAGIIQGDR